MSRRLAICLSLPLLWLTGCTDLSIGNESSRHGRVTVITGDIPTLERGMPADEVRRKLGAPAEIKPVKSSNGSAEIWVYYLEKFVGKTQVVNYVNRPAFGGALNDPTGMVSEPVYLLADQKVLVTLKLLILDGRLSVHSANKEQRIGF